MIRALGLLVASLIACSALAQSGYPNRPIRMIIPWPPGQATDWVGRVIAMRVSESMGQQVVADNRPGAGGAIGTELAAKASADGYTVLAASSGPITILPLLQKVGYDVEQHFTPVALAGRSPFVLVSAPSFKTATAREFVALARANPGKFSFSSSGTGATAHLVSEWFNMNAGIKGVHVPYKGSVQGIADVMSGQVTYTVETLTATLPHVRSGRLRGYGVTVAKRTALAPDLPPLAEAADLPGFDITGWTGVMVARGTPKSIVDQLARAVDKAMQMQETRERLASVGVEVDYRAAAEFSPFLVEQKRIFSDIIKRGNIKLE